MLNKIIVLRYWRSPKSQQAAAHYETTRHGANGVVLCERTRRHLSQTHVKCQPFDALSRCHLPRISFNFWRCWAMHRQFLELWQLLLHDWVRKQLPVQRNYPKLNGSTQSAYVSASPNAAINVTDCKVLIWSHTKSSYRGYSFVTSVPKTTCPHKFFVPSWGTLSILWASHDAHLLARKQLTHNHRCSIENWPDSASLHGEVFDRGVAVKFV